MRYLGGKATIARDLAGIINTNARERSYWEPFVGACNVIARVHARKRYASDLHAELIAMWQALQNGWIPPSTVTQEEYYAAKAGPCAPELRAFIGFGCSLGGKWWGSYARAEGRNWADEGARSSLAKIAKLRDVEFFHADYRDGPPERDMVIYCDPPYVNTSGYSVGKLDTPAFWSTVRDWSSAGHIVLVSECQAPDDFIIVWQKAKMTGERAGGGKKRTRFEKMFAHKSVDLNRQIALF